MASYEFLTVDVFTDRRFGGNPLAVFPAASGLDAGTMQALAREFNLSETTFVFPPEDAAHTARVRIFTPAGEVPFAGHPNVGTGYALGRRAGGAGVLVFEETAGLVEVRLQRDAAGEIARAEIAAPRALTMGEEIDPSLVAECVGLHPSDVAVAVHRPLVAGVGLEFVFAELANADALRRAAPDASAFRRAIERHPGMAGHSAVHLYVRDAAAPHRLDTRMFAPLLGVNEDPATGSANAALAALLLSLAPTGTAELSFDITQGIAMGRPSRLLANARRTAANEVRAAVGGGCVDVMRGTVDA